MSATVRRAAAALLGALFALSAGTALAQMPDEIFADGFEEGTLDAWSGAATGGGDLAVDPGAALASSSFGLQAVVNDTDGLFVEDALPVDEDRYRVRFYFDPNGFDPGEAELHLRTRIFIAFEEAPTRRLLAVVLRRQAGAYAVMARARLDDNRQQNTGFVPVTNAPHSIEVDWKRSSGPDANDGSLKLWVDGALVAHLSDLDNSVSAVDFVRMGALSVKAGASGTLKFDEMFSRSLLPPGAVTPGLGDVFITEVMMDPVATTDANGEWVELYNAGSEPALLVGCELGDGTPPTHTISSIAIRPGEFATLARSSMPGFNPDEVFGGLALLNANGTVSLACGTTLDIVMWATSTAGAARQLRPDRFDPASNDLDGSWCTALIPFDVGGDRGSPGTANHNCP